MLKVLLILHPVTWFIEIQEICKFNLKYYKSLISFELVTLFLSQCYSSDFENISIPTLGSYGTVSVGFG